MAEDWGANVKKYVPDADDNVIAGIVRYCGIALRNRDSSLVSFSDPAETARVRENFLKKKLALTHSDTDLDTAIAEVGERMKGENFKNRVTVYYLLAEKFGAHGLFAKGAAAVAAAGASVAAAASNLVDDKDQDGDKDLKDVAIGAGEAVTGAAAAATGAVAHAADAAGDAIGSTAAKVGAGAAAVGAAVAGAAAAAGDKVESAVGAIHHDSEPADAHAGRDYIAAPVPEERSGLGWLWWLLLGLLALFLLWWLFMRPHGAPHDDHMPPPDAAAPPATTDASGSTSAASGAVDLSAAPAEGTVTIPTGAGVTSETRDGKPVVKVYFDSGKADVVPTFGATAAGVKAWLDGHAGSSLQVSGYNDPTGNAAANAELSKKRAQAVKADLVKAGIADTAVELVKPEATTDKTVDKASARRVEVTVK